MTQIPLTVDSSYANTWTREDVSKLIDDRLDTSYSPGWAMIKPFRQFFIFDDFDKSIVQRIVCGVNNNSSYNVRFYVRRKDTGADVLIFTLTQGSWPPGEKSFDVPTQFDASHLIVETDDGAGFPAYIQAWGDWTAKAQVVTQRPRKPLKSLMGIVMHSGSIGFMPSAGNRAIPKFKDVILGLAPTYLRVYLEAGRIRDINGNYHFNDWGLQDNLPALKALGIYTRICWEGQSADINNTYPKDEDQWGNRLLKTTVDIPYSLNNRADKLKPETYLEYGKNIYQLTKNEVAPEIEAHNENDKTWWGEFGNQSAEEQAVMFSVGYDGHEGKFPSVGVKQADPNRKFCIGGFAFDRPDPMFLIREWCLKNRKDKKIPGQTISFHSYDSLEYQNSGGGDRGSLPPEIFQLPKIKRMADWRNKYAPDMDLDIGEYGWDIAKGSPNFAAPYGKYTSEQTRANWFVRFILCCSEIGVDFAQYYQFMMDGMWMEGNGGVFATMELVRQLTDLKEITSDVYDVETKRVLTGDYFRQISLGLGDYTFKERVSTSPRVLKFSNGTSDVYAIWEVEDWKAVPIDPNNPGGPKEPTFTERTGTYTIAGQLLTLADDGSGAMVKGSTVTSVQYGAKPVFVIAGSTPPTPPPTKEIYHRGYWTVNGKRTFYINYKDKTWTLANGKYEPI
jgi:hypothetical protein